MKERTGRRGHGGLIVLLIVIVLLALVCAAPFVYNAATHFAYEDYAAIASADTERFHISPAGDGEHLLFHADKADAYAMLLENDVLTALQEETGGRIELEQLGYTLRAGADELEVRAALKLLGFLPVQLRALADVSVGGDQVFIRPKEVWYGYRIRIDSEKLANWTGIAELTEGVTLSLEEYTKPLRADAVRLEGEGLTISSPLLAEVIDEVRAEAKKETAVRLLRLYFGDGDPAAQAIWGDGRADFIRAAGASYAALRSALRDVAAYGSDVYRCGLTDELSAFPVDLNSALAAFPALREAQIQSVAEAQRTCFTAQTELRHAYWYKEVMLKEGRLTEPDGTPLEARLPAEWEARIVLQYNENYDAIVKTNEGNPRLQVPVPGLPMMSELPRDSRASLPPEGDGPFDLSVALRLPSGIPVVVFLTAEDECGVAVISEALFEEIHSHPGIPIYSSKTIAAAPRDTWLRLTGLPDDLPVGNYIGAE